MVLNLNKPQMWKEDIQSSVDLYNDWFKNFAPVAFRTVRNKTITKVRAVFEETNNLKNISVENLICSPQNLQILRMATCPPLARDRLIGIADISKNLVKKMEDKIEPSIPPRMSKENLEEQLNKAISLISQLLDNDIITWKDEQQEPTSDDVERSIAVIADRLCGADTNPIIRNAQEERQLQKLEELFIRHGYRAKDEEHDIFTLEAGEYAKHINVPVTNNNGDTVNISVDWAFVPLERTSEGGLPILIEAKSAGDFTNVNKRRKEEAQKMSQLKKEYGEDVNYILFLTGYFDAGYLGYEASEGIDWFWEHRISDIECLL